ncbi:MAG TPA: YIP1 family protein [Candidatus Aquilonibacter sp.]|nr:YIP1 family protein [Candidatus Aquilonibacter sp.]
MQQVASVSEAQPPLSEAARVVDTFVAPSKTFTDIRRKATWWLPFILMCIVSFFFTSAVGKQIGFETIAHQQIDKNHFAADQINSLPRDQQVAAYQSAGKRTKVVSYFYPVLIFVFAAIISLLWWASLNFGLGAQSKYWQIFAVGMYAGLPKLFIFILAAILLYAGVGLDNFDMQNPIGTNLGYFISPDSPALRAAGSFLDVFGIWSLILAIYGTAIVTKKKPSQTAVVIVGWWIVGLIVVTALAAFTA